MPKRKLSESNISDIQSPTRSYKKMKKLGIGTKKTGISEKKLVEDQNQFQDWEWIYFVAQNDGQAVCLICRKVLPTIKKSDIEQHYLDLHEEQFRDCSSDDKIEVLKKLKNSNCLLPLLTDSPGRPTKPEVKPEEEEITLVERLLSLSYAISLKIAQEARPFSHGEVIKKTSIDYARARGDEKMVKDYKLVAVSQPTLSRRIVDLNIYIEHKIKSQLQNCRYFSLCLCEDSHKHHLMIFARITQSDFTTSEELLNLTSMVYSFKDDNILELLKQTMEKCGDFRKCTAVVMSGKKFGIGFENRLQTCGITCPKYSLKVDYEILIGKVFEKNKTIKKVEEIIHLFIRMKKPLENFKTFAKEAEVAYRNLTSKSKLLWLYQNNYFEKIFRWQKDIIRYIKMSHEANIAHYQDFFEDSHFLSELALLADLTTMIEKLNLNLQQPDQCIADLSNNIQGFQIKLQKLMKQIENGELGELVCCDELAKMYSVNFSELASIIENIIEEFNIRFRIFLEMQADIQLFENPLSVRLEYQRRELQYELCYLQADAILIGRKLRAKEFFKMLNQEHYPKLKDFGLKIFSMFGSSQICENAHSIISNLVFHTHKKTLVGYNEFVRVGTSKTPVNTLELIRNRESLVKSRK